MADLITKLGGASGFGENTLVPDSDGRSAYIDLTAAFPDGLNFHGRLFAGMYVSQDGSISLSNSAPTGYYNGYISAFSALTTIGEKGDPTPGGKSTGSGQVYWDIDPVRRAVTITWDDVITDPGYLGKTGRNAFQLRLIDLGPTTGTKGDFDIALRYEAINAAASRDLAYERDYYPAVVRIDNGDGKHWLELPQSGDDLALLGLPDASNIGSPGTFLFKVRAAQSGTIEAVTNVPLVQRDIVVPLGDGDFDYAPVDGTYEGNGPVTPLHFTLTRTGSVAAAADITWFLRTGTGNRYVANVEGSDLAGGLTSGTVRFEAGQSQIDVAIALNSDTKLGPDKEFSIVFTSAELGSSTEDTFYVFNDDPANPQGTDDIDSLEGNAWGDTIDGKGGGDSIFGDGYPGGNYEGGDDTLVGGAGNDSIYAGIGNDRLYGGTENDWLYGESGDDFVQGGAGADRVNGGSGTDTLSYADAAAAVLVDTQISRTQNALGGGYDELEDLFENLEGSIFSDKLLGNKLANVLTGLAGNDTIDGRAGADTLIGGLGSDTYTVDNIGDVVVEAASEGIDRILARVSFAVADNVEQLTLIGTAAVDGTGNAAANQITGNAAANALAGFGGADRLIGNAGDDRLVGGAGADLLRGGDGVDTFVFDVFEASSQRDYVVDFVLGTDKIALTQATFAALSGTADVLDPAQFATGTRALTADQHLIYNADKGFLFYDADGKGGAAQVLIALFAGKPAIDASDFVLA